MRISNNKHKYEHFYKFKIARISFGQKSNSPFYVVLIHWEINFKTSIELPFKLDDDEKQFKYSQERRVSCSCIWESSVS